MRGVTVVIFFSVVVTVVLAADPQPPLVRTWKDRSLIDLSRDARWILTSSAKRLDCADGKNRCYAEALTVYDVASGKPVGEVFSRIPPASALSNQYDAPEFVDGNRVQSVERTQARLGAAVAEAWITWEP